MGRFTRIAMGGLAATLLAASGVLAENFLLTDFENGSESYIDNYYYIYDSDPGTGVVTSANLVNDQYGKYSFKEISGSAGTGAFSGGLDITGYTLVEDEGTCTNSYGDPRCDPTYGFGILMTPNDYTGYGSKFSGVTAIRMKLKYFSGSNSELGVRFKVETIHNTEDAAHKYPGIPTTSIPKENNQTYNAKTANAYSIVIKVPKTEAGDGKWLDTTIRITPIKDPGSTLNYKAITNQRTGVNATDWGEAGQLHQADWWGYHFPFKLDQVTHIAWQLDAGDNAAMKADIPVSFRVDDVELIGDFTYTSPDKCNGCEATIGGWPTGAILLSNFENEDPVQNERGFYWYTYTDSDNPGEGTSRIRGLIENPRNPTGPKIMNVAGNGNGGGAGAYIEFVMGDKYVKPSTTTDINPFVGIGTNLYDDQATDDAGKYWYNTTNLDGVFFEYKTSSDVDWLFVELADYYDMLDEIGPTGNPPGNGKPDGDDDGETFYTKVPGTAGLWKAVQITFNKFVLPSWVQTNGHRRNVAPKTQLDRTRIAQLKFKRQGGGANSEGDIAIDNVYFFGDGTSVKLLGSKSAAASGIRASYSRGVVGVNWNAATNVASGNISLINTKGRVVASVPIAASGNRVTAKLGVSRIPTGMYFVRVNAKDVNGKKIVQNAPLSIVK